MSRRRGSYFDVNCITHLSEIHMSPATRSYDTAISIRPKFRAKRYRSELYLFPLWNNRDKQWACRMKMHVTSAYYKKGLARQNLRMQQIIVTQGEVKKKFRKDINIKTSVSSYCINFHASKQNPLGDEKENRKRESCMAAKMPSIVRRMLSIINIMAFVDTKKYRMRLLLVLVALAHARCAILRTQCEKEASFEVVILNKVLPSSAVFRVLPKANKNECAKACFTDKRCMSFNFCFQYASGCELNSQYFGYPGTALVARENWAYISTDYTATELGSNCRKHNPCGKGILCRDKCEAPFYECVTCDASHEGLHCDIRKDVNECASSPCQNGGTCSDAVNSYTCQCMQGFAGTRCETDVNECLSSPCVHGVCINNVNSYSCTCTVGYSGTKCDSDVNECSSAPCIHGTCNNLANSYSCTCHLGYTGIRCATDVNECLSSPCVHGVCINNVNSYSCTCTVGYSGTKCDSDVNECSSAPCIHGTCNNLANSYSCTCHPGYTGTRCATGIF
eukprot:gene13908-15357_t